MSGAAGCGLLVLWAAGLCVFAAAIALTVVLPRNREGLHLGMAGGMAAGLFVTAVWYVSTACGVW